MESLNASAQSLHFSIHSSACRSPLDRQTHFVPGSVSALDAASQAVWNDFPVCLAWTAILKRESSLVHRDWYGNSSSNGETLRFLYLRLTVCSILFEDRAASFRDFCGRKS